VHVTRLAIKGTVEERILELQVGHSSVCCVLCVGVLRWIRCICTTYKVYKVEILGKS